MPIVTGGAFPNTPPVIGFDELEGLLARLARGPGGGNYPPYNIARIPGGASDGGDCLRLTLAVAGFAPEELAVTVEDGLLRISGRQAQPDTATYLHRGIAARPFLRSFALGGGLTVERADLENGLLAIDLAVPRADAGALRIDIARRG